MSDSKPVITKAETIARYKRMLEEHDWDFEASDDGRAWRLGRLALEQLQFLRRELDPDWAIWNAYAPAAHRHHIPNLNPLYPDCNS